MCRLKYAQKFVLIGLVLIAPLAFVVKSYLDQQSTQIGFSQKERVGVAYVKPVTELLARITAARATAVRLAAHQATPSALAAARAQIDSAIGSVDAAAKSSGATLSLENEWTGLKQQIQAVTAGPVSTPQKTLDSYDALAAAALKLVV